MIQADFIVPKGLKRLVNHIIKQDGDLESVLQNYNNDPMNFEWHGKRLIITPLFTSYGTIGYSVEYDGYDLSVDNEFGTIEWNNMSDFAETEIVEFPFWAVNNIVCGDDDITDEQYEMIEDYFKKEWSDKGKRIVTVTPYNEKNYTDYKLLYSDNPVFGLPCRVVECEVKYIDYSK